MLTECLSAETCANLKVLLITWRSYQLPLRMINESQLKVPLRGMLNRVIGVR